MRQLIVLTVVFACIAVTGCKSGIKTEPAPANKTEPAPAPAKPNVEIQGTAFYSDKCLEVAKEALGKVNGISRVGGDVKSRTLTFRASEAGYAQKALDVLREAGLNPGSKMIPDAKVKLVTDLQIFERVGSAISGGSTEKSTAKPDEVTVNRVLACDEACEKAITALFPGATVTFAGAGNQKNVTVAAKDVKSETVLKTLHDAGFAGYVKP